MPSPFLSLSLLSTNIYVLSIVRFRFNVGQSVGVGDLIIMPSFSTPSLPPENIRTEVAVIIFVTEEVHEMNHLGLHNYHQIIKHSMDLGIEISNFTNVVHKIGDYHQIIFKNAMPKEMFVTFSDVTDGSDHPMIT